MLTEIYDIKKNYDINFKRYLKSCEYRVIYKIYLYILKIMILIYIKIKIFEKF